MSLPESGLRETVFPNVWALTASLVLCYVIYTITYRIYFHPLASFPGPFWARLSVIPSWWHTRTGDRHIWLYGLQEKYGTCADSENDIVVTDRGCDQVPPSDIALIVS